MSEVQIALLIAGYLWIGLMVVLGRSEVWKEFTRLNVNEAEYGGAIPPRAYIPAIALWLVFWPLAVWLRSPESSRNTRR